tara:strand:- start:530 stop:1327 length:798 start_codon:yes stop_codon:yes gene_type:complete
MVKYRESSYFGEWLLNIYLAHPTLREDVSTAEFDAIVPHRTIDNKFLYKKATLMDSDNYLIRFNKTIYDWIIDMLPKSFNDKDSRFLSDQHLLYQPKLEFENWFMKNGLTINECKSMSDDWKVIENEVSSAVSISKLEILENENKALTKKTKELSHKLKNAKKNYLEEYEKLKTTWMVTDKNWLGEKLESSVKVTELQWKVDTQCRMKNGRFVKARFGVLLGCNRDTAFGIINQDDEFRYLVDTLYPKDTGGKYISLGSHQKRLH